MKAVSTAAWGLLAGLAVWDVASALDDGLVGSVAFCILSFITAVPALAIVKIHNLYALRLWNLLARLSPYAAAGSLGISHFILKNQPGGALIVSVTYLVALFAFAELARWVRFCSGFGGNIAEGVDSAWARTFGSRFVPLFVLSAGLAMMAVVLALGFNGTWTALALAVGLIVTIALTTRTAARVA